MNKQYPILIPAYNAASTIGETTAYLLKSVIDLSRGHRKIVNPEDGSYDTPRAHA